VPARLILAALQPTGTDSEPRIFFTASNGHLRTKPTETQWTWLADAGVSGAVLPESRKRFRAVLALLEPQEAVALISTKVDRASRCTENFARLLRMSEEQGWRLIVTEMGIDTRTPMGKAMAHMAVVFAELERDPTRERESPPTSPHPDPRDRAPWRTSFPESELQEDARQAHWDPFLRGACAALAEQDGSCLLASAVSRRAA
jgi:hypothetical protein